MPIFHLHMCCRYKDKGKRGRHCSMKMRNMKKRSWENNIYSISRYLGSGKDRCKTQEKAYAATSVSKWKRSSRPATNPSITAHSWSTKHPRPKKRTAKTHANASGWVEVPKYDEVEDYPCDHGILFLSKLDKRHSYPTGSRTAIIWWRQKREE